MISVDLQGYPEYEGVGVLVGGAITSTHVGNSLVHVCNC